MFPPKKILFPVDFSERSVAFAPMVRALADRFSGELTLLHVESPSREIPEPISACERLEQFAKRPEFEGLDVRTLILQGNPAEQIVNFAHEQKSDLIVMPTHGYGPVRRFLLGSVTLKVLHDAWCPVWTDAHMEDVTSSQAPPGQFRNIVCAVDLGDQSHPTLHWASQFAEETGARLRVVYAIPRRGVVESQAKERVESLQVSEGTHGEVAIVGGEVAEAVGSAAEEAHADLLVIGRTVDDRLLGRLRTHSYPIIRHSPCPVVSV